VCSACAKQETRCHYATVSTETHSQALKRKYDELQARGAPYQEIFHLLRSLPEQEAYTLVERIRSGDDATSIVERVRDGDLLLQLRLLPETRFRYEFPYISEMPTALLPNNPYLGSMIYEAQTLFSSPNQGTPSSQSSTSGLDRAGSPEMQSLYLKPLHAADVVDARLSLAQPSLWTSVCSDDTLMRSLLGVFLRCEYHVTTAFHKDYFLEDMVAQRDEFCSPLLVNAVLAYSCVRATARPFRAST
jgi:hypothetical protein